MEKPSQLVLSKFLVPRLFFVVFVFSLPYLVWVHACKRQVFKELWLTHVGVAFVSLILVTNLLFQSPWVRSLYSADLKGVCTF